LRFYAGPMELTALILLTPGTQRAQDLATRLEERLPHVAAQAVEGLEARLFKTTLIESDLQELNSGIDNRERINVVVKGLKEAQSLLFTERYAEAYLKARQMGRVIRQIVKYQVARALTTPIEEGDEEKLR